MEDKEALIGLLKEALKENLIIKEHDDGWVTCNSCYIGGWGIGTYGEKHEEKCWVTRAENLIKRLQSDETNNGTRDAGHSKSS